VVHSFWIAPFLFKRDLIPGPTARRTGPTDTGTTRQTTFTVIPIKTGAFIGRCSELCGVYHSRMLFRVKIVSQAQFKTWIAAQQAQQKASGGAS